MISFYSIKIVNAESYQEILKYVPKFLIDEYVIVKLQKNLGLNCNEIRIEYPYYDSDYLSTYRIHYSHKLKRYEKKCCRLHILKDNEYYGYIVLRPTVEGTKIGRTLLNPEILLKERAYLPLFEFKIHVAGNNISVGCFPWKSQETDISVCAHTAT